MMKKAENGRTRLWVVVVSVAVIIILIYLCFFAGIGNQVIVSVATSTPSGVATSTGIRRADITVVSPNGIASWKAFTDVQAHIFFKYPATWTAPVKSSLGTRYLFNFKNGLTLEVGQFYNTNATKVLTIPELIENISAQDIVSSSVKADGKTATKVTYTQTSDSQQQTKFFITNRSATDIIVVTNQNNLIASSVVSAFVGTITSK